MNMKNTEKNKINETFTSFVSEGPPELRYLFVDFEFLLLSVLSLSDSEEISGSTTIWIVTKDDSNIDTIRFIW